tara:strand:- start:9371 stop:9568 length:198 start_codon:yes stop_codon:yes gene_type:complete
MDNKDDDIKVYRLKIVYRGDEILHLSESLDNEGEVTLSVGGETIVIPREMADILNTLDSDELGLS